MAARYLAARVAAGPLSQTFGQGSGRVCVISSNVWPLISRRPGDVGLYTLIGIFPPETDVRLPDRGNITPHDDAVLIPAQEIFLLDTLK